MNATLFLLRHAKSSWATALPDMDRPLAKRGRRDAPAMGQWFASQYPPPARVLCSSARRCRQTLSLFLSAMATPGADVTFSSDLYHASGSALIRAIEPHLATCSSLLLVSHNPGLDELLWHLAGEPLPLSANGKLMTTCALATVQPGAGPNPLGPGCATLRSLMRPRELPSG